MKDLTIKDLGEIDNEKTFYAMIGKLAGKFNIEIYDENTEFVDEYDWRVHYLINVESHEALDLWLELENDKLIINTHRMIFNDNKGLLSQDTDYRFQSGESYEIKNNNTSIIYEMAQYLVVALEGFKVNLKTVSDVYDAAKKVINDNKKYYHPLP